MGNIPSVVSGQLATAAQYNALQSGLNPLVENVYTSWALVAGYPFSLGGTIDALIGFFSSFISIDDIRGIVYYYDWSAAFFSAFKISPPTALVNGGLLYNVNPVTSSTYGQTGTNAMSSTGLYWATIGTGGNTLTVYKGGVDIFSIDIGISSHYVSSGYAISQITQPVVSKTGQYIAVAATSTQPKYYFEDFWVLEGQP